jgi:hypothetical protein
LVVEGNFEGLELYSDGKSGKYAYLRFRNGRILQLNGDEATAAFAGCRSGQRVRVTRGTDGTLIKVDIL